MSLMGFTDVSLQDLDSVLDNDFQDLDFLWAPVKQLMDSYITFSMRNIQSSCPKTIMYYWDSSLKKIPEYSEFLSEITEGDQEAHDKIDLINFKNTWKKLKRRDLLTPELLNMIFVDYISENKFTKSIITSYFGTGLNISSSTRLNDTILNLVYSDSSSLKETLPLTKKDINIIDYVSKKLKYNGLS